MKEYICLSKNNLIKGSYRLVPIRFEDRYSIMRWRNSQMYHLRQDKLLTEHEQDHYFEHVVSKLFDQEKPDQILFSFLRDNICIGYGGLVHINWIDRNAEISFIMQTELESKEFSHIWSVYLKLIEKVAFADLHLHKFYVYAFDLRPHLYEVLLASGFFEDARLREHCYYKGEYLDVVIHSKTNSLL